MLSRFKPKSEFARNILTLATGTTVAQAIPIVISPILTRIYSPEDFGVLALYASIVSMFAIFATWRYELAIMLPKEDSSALMLLYMAILISLTMGFILLVFILIFHENLINVFGNEDISIWLYLVPFSVALSGIYQSINYWMNRKKLFSLTSKVKVIQTSATAGSNLMLGFSGLLNGGLILSVIIGQVVLVFVYIKKLVSDTHISFQNVNVYSYVSLLRQYSVFPKVNTLHAAINELKFFLTIQVISRFYDSEMLGLFYLVNRIIMLPMTLIGSAISDTFYQRISSKHSSGDDFSKDVLHLSIVLFLLALIPSATLFFYGKEIFIIVFGKSWEQAGNMASAMSVYMLFHFIASPISYVAIVLNKQTTAFWLNLVGTTIFVGSLLLGYYIFHDLVHSLLILSFAMAIYFIISFIWIYKISIIKGTAE